MYKIKEKLVPNISSEHELVFEWNGRRGITCERPSFHPITKASRARDNSFAWTAYNLWNSLPQCVRNIAGEDVTGFKNKLDKVLAFYPDIPRCGGSGHSYDRYGRKSNSLYDHYNYRGLEFRRVLENINIT